MRAGLGLTDDLDDAIWSADVELLRELIDGTPPMSADDGDLATWAIRYARVGLPVFPLLPGGKVPIIAGGHTRASSEVEQVRAWWASTPDANIGLRMGDGIDVIDVERAGLTTLCKMDNFPPILAVSATRGGGLHIWIHTKPEAGRHIKPLPNCDVLGARTEKGVSVAGYVIAPPSVVPADDGSPSSYRWMRALDPEWRIQ